MIDVDRRIRPKRWVGIDVGGADSAVCVIDADSNVVREDRVLNSPDAAHDFLCLVDGTIELIGLEASSLSLHIVRGLRERGYAASLFDSRQTRKYLRIRQNKTDRNDARGLAEIALHGREVVPEVRVKSLECQKLRSQLAIRQQLVRQRIAAEASIRAVIRLNGGHLKKCTSAKMLRLNVGTELMKIRDFTGVDLIDAISPVLKVCEQLRNDLARIDREFASLAISHEICRRFLQISGIGPIGALSFYTAVEEPTRFNRNEDIGPYLGMVPLVKQSGPIVRRFKISRMGNKMTRQHLMTAASIHIRRAPENGAIRAWGEKLRKRLPAQKVRIAVARKLAVVMLAMWKNGSDFQTEGTYDPAASRPSA